MPYFEQKFPPGLKRPTSLPAFISVTGGGPMLFIEGCHGVDHDSKREKALKFIIIPYKVNPEIISVGFLADVWGE